MRKKRFPLRVLIQREMKLLPPVKDQRLAFLLKWANVQKPTKDVRSLAERRAAYYRGNPRGTTLVGQCWACSGWADVFNHHIVQLQNGGTNHHRNLVRICGECHRVIHPWLRKPSEPTQHVGPEPELDRVPF